MKGTRLIMLMSLILVFAVGIVYAGNVEKGKTFFNDTNLGTNGKSCNTCHPDGKDIDGNKNTFIILGEKQNSIEDAVNFCIEKALNGKPLEKDSEEMKNIVSYLKTLKGKKKRRGVAPGY